MHPSDTQYKPKTTIIQAAPLTFTQSGLLVVAWVIEDGKIARPITSKSRMNGDRAVIVPDAGSVYE